MKVKILKRILCQDRRGVEIEILPGTILELSASPSVTKFAHPSYEFVYAHIALVDTLHYTMPDGKDITIIFPPDSMGDAYEPI